MRRQPSQQLSPAQYRRPSGLAVATSRDLACANRACRNQAAAVTVDLLRALLRSDHGVAELRRRHQRLRRELSASPQVHA